MSASSTPSRRPQACERCWKRKQKCVPRQFRVEPSSEDNSGLSHAALPGYVDALKQRVRTLETLSHRKRRQVTTDDSDSTVTPSIPADGHDGLDSSVQTAMGEIGFLSRSAMAEPRDETSAFPRQLSMSQMLQTILALSGSNPSQTQSVDVHASQWSLLGVADPLRALSSETAAPFLRSFLDRVATFYLHFDTKELQEQYETFFADERRGSGDASDPARCYREASVCLALAIGMLISPQSGRYEVLAQALHSAAVKAFPRILQSGSSVDLIHSLLLMIMYSMLSSSGGSTWHLLGLALKKSISFRMHKDPDPVSPVSPEEAMKRGVLFWNLYIVDRTLCTAMERPYGIEDEDISLSLPKLSPHGTVEFELERHLVLHAKLISSIRNSGEPCPLYHYRNICFWRELPPEIRAFLDSNEVLRRHVQRLSFRSLMQILPLHMAMRYDNEVLGRQTAEIDRDVVGNCETIIEQMYRALDEASPGGAFTDGYDIFAAGVAIICSGGQSAPNQILDQANLVNKCVAVLTALGQRFSGFKVFRRVLLALSDLALGRRSQELARSPAATATPVNGKRTVYLLDTLHPDAVEHAKTLFNIVAPGDKDLNNWREKASAIVIRGSHITAEDIARAPNLIAIGKHGVGIDKIDQKACSKRGIKILNTPGANARDVAELVVALTMTVARSIRSITTRQMTAPVPKETCTGLSLQQKTIGVIGMGNIGRTVAEIFYGGFDAKLIAFDAFLPEDAWSHLPHKRAKSVQEVIEQADVLTLHVPLTEETRSMLSYKELKQMRPDAILINAARGGIVNEGDLTRVLSEGHLWGAGIDCHEQEPPSAEKYGKLWENLNVVSTPHIGAATNTAQRASSMAAVNNLLHIPLHAVCDEQRPTVWATKAAVGQVLAPFLSSDNPGFGNALRPSLTLVCKVEVAVRRDNQIVGASPFGSPSQRAHCVTCLSSSIRKIRPPRAGPALGSLDFLVFSDYILGYTMGLIADTRKAFREAPKGIFNWYVFAVTWVFALAGVAKGFDEDEYAGTKGWIVSIATAGAVFGCLGSLPINDRIGRRWTLRLGTLVYIAGILGQGLCNGNLGGLYTSRVISGMGIGVTTIVPPVYISEIAPKAIRGLLTLQYAACQQLGVVLGFFINYGVTKKYEGTDTQWMLPTLLQILPAVLWAIGTFACPESPRWLRSVGRREESVATLSKLRHLSPDHPVVVGELEGMDAQILHEHESVASASQWQLLKETLIPVQNRRRFFLLFMATLFSQWSGANAITQYSPTIFGYLGIEGDEAKFLTTGIYGVVKFASTLIFAVVIVDFVGRRRSLLTGITLQILTLVFIGAYLGATKDMTPAEIKASPNAERASTAAIVAIYLHAVAWSIGWFSIPYLIGPEIFPTRIRSLNMAISMALHWAFYFGCSKAMPSLLAATHRWGAFVFFTCICVCGLVYVFFAMPDTTGRSLEALDALFERPWYSVHKVAYASKDDIQIETVGKDMGKPDEGGSEHLESADKV
ncbi:hypothetical protein BJY01DRAFT_238805 [Aspergillus pseudoustus]|uniref:Major facilitator superfamily (MFS) profile domain-containing protein n=1 Tax=Aspergillus pseudoustus TaxID=1810923 RepID=A0ABR4J5Z9_9EURO